MWNPYTRSQVQVQKAIDKQEPATELDLQKLLVEILPDICEIIYLVLVFLQEFFELPFPICPEQEALLLFTTYVQTTMQNYKQ